MTSIKKDNIQISDTKFTRSLRWKKFFCTCLYKRKDNKTYELVQCYINKQTNLMEFMKNNNQSIFVKELLFKDYQLGL